MVRARLTAGVPNRKGVGYVERYEDAARLEEWARARYHKKVRIVISPNIPPADAPKIISTLRIGGFESRSAEERFRPVSAPQTGYKDPLITVVNPIILYHKNQSLVNLQRRYMNEYQAREDVKDRLREITGELNQIAIKAQDVRAKIKDHERDIKALLLIRSASKPGPLHVPEIISNEDKASYFSFLVNPAYCVKHLFPGSEPEQMNTSEAIASGIASLRMKLGLTPFGGDAEISSSLSTTRKDLALAKRRLVSLEADRDILTERASAEKFSEKVLTEKVIPHIRKLMRSPSAYGSEDIC